MTENVRVTLVDTVSGLRRSMMWRRWPVAVIAGCLLSWSGVEAAELSVGDLKMQPSGTAKAVVSGKIDGECTFGWSVMLELVPRKGNTGTVTFTTVPSGLPEKRAPFVVRENPGHLATVRLEQIPEPEDDIEQVVDVWANAGTFTPFDTQRTGSVTLNGAVDENGTFVGAPVTFAGVLARFPIVASADAGGIWDLMLSTSAGDSSWEGVKTRLINGSVTISVIACLADRDCDDRDPCTNDACKAGTCRHVPNRDGACRERELSRKRNLKGSEAEGLTQPRGSADETNKSGR